MQCRKWEAAEAYILSNSAALQVSPVITVQHVANKAHAMDPATSQSPASAVFQPLSPEASLTLLFLGSPLLQTPYLIVTLLLS